MSSLHLVPNPTIIAVQAGVFLANFVIVKKLYLDPYLKLTGKREAMTDGSQEESASIERKNAETSAQMETQLRELNVFTHEYRMRLNADAEDKSAKILQLAEKQAASVVAEVQEEIKLAIAKEAANIPETIEELTSAIYKQTLSI